MCERCGQLEEKCCSFLHLQGFRISTIAKNVKMRLRSKSDSTHDRSKLNLKRQRRKGSDSNIPEEVFQENGKIVSKVRKVRLIYRNFMTADLQ